MTLRCLLRHRTSVAYGSSLGIIACERCGALLDWWRITRPEEQHRVDRQRQVLIDEVERQALIEEREQRAAEMAMPAIRAKVLNMRTR